MSGSNLARVAFNKVLEVPANLGSRLIAWPPVASRAGAAYGRAREAHKERVPDLSPADAAIVADLKRTGVHITSLDTLGLTGSDALLDRGRALYARYVSDGTRDPTRARSFQAGAADVMANREIFYWGLNDRLLDIVENYLGVPIGYDGINIFFTKADGRQVAARRWHRDVEDRHMVKIAVYLNDVDEGGGPLQVLRRKLPQHDRTVRGKFPILTQEELERRLADFRIDRDVTTCMGKTGTVVFADTASHYHRGKPATTHDRCAVYFNYFHRVPLRPFRCERSTISRAQIRELAEPLLHRQRDCLLWRESLPMVARLLPPAPVWE
ncbi:hypothetical protein [Lichenifustis flavocetrariae]|uniref:Fe2OG dioxygenase domain-containing protein n=1 Tax=Lichenifustis flavocetrariae TaxID=2949735 RepID=A0AA41Z189_9HYPH|nr:hypothetical protein [Lichenifustis flavocetrariae]MCW6508545.1 hypothetical protein [Lichenifustis flavocetrariae]